MPTPILKIPVDDAAFQRYLAAFNKYQTQLKDQPDLWQGTSKGINDAALAASALAAMLAQQADETRKLAEEEKKRDDERKKANDDRRREENEVRKREEAATRRRKEAISQVKEYAKTLTNTAIDFGKWTLGGGLVGSALGMFGLTQLAGGAADQLRSSAGMGVSISQNQGMQLTMQRYFDVNSVMSNMANAVTDPSQWGALRMMGVDPKGKNAADLTYETARAARRMFLASGQNVAMAEAQGLTRFFSPEDLRRMAAEKPQEFEKSISQGRKFDGLSDSAGRKWQNFMRSVEIAGLKIQNTLADRLTRLEPSLAKLIDKFGQLAVKVLDQIDFDALGQGLDTFTKYISDGRFQKDFKTFIDDVGAVAEALKNALVFLRIIPDPEADALQKYQVDHMRRDFKAQADYIDSLPGKAWDGLKGAANSAGKWFGSLFSGENNGSKADRNNNPGNLIDPHTGHFRKFSSLEEGASAMAKQLMRNYSRGQNTVRSMINHPSRGWSNEWSPGNSHASTAAYIDRVSKDLGVTPDTPLNLNDDRTLKKLMYAMNSVERGGARKPGSSGSGYRGHGRQQVHVKIQNQTGASIATNVNSAVNG